MFRLLITSCLCLVIGYYARDYNIFSSFTQEAPEPINQTLTRFGKVCTIVRPVGYEKDVVHVSKDLQIYDDFTTKQLSMEKNSTSNSTEMYFCYLSVDTEEYKLTSAVRGNHCNSCYREIFKCNSFKYETKYQNYQIQRICCPHKKSNVNVACTMTNWLSEQTDYDKKINPIPEESSYMKYVAAFMFLIILRKCWYYFCN